MKKRSKLFSLILAAVLMVAMSVPSFAATVTVPAGNTHTYAAYQVFTGTQATDKGALGNVAWGNGINKDAFLNALKGNATVGNDFKDCSTAADVAKVLGTYTSNSPKADIVAEIAYKNIIKSAGKTITAGENTLTDGYYLIVDTTNVAGQYDVKNKALLQVTKTINITEKMDKPYVEKKVKEESYTPNDGYGPGYNDVADYDIGDKVPFSFYSKVPTHIGDYTEYKYIFHDTMSAGLTFDKDSVKVTIGGTVLTSGYTVVSPAADGHTFDIVINDLKAISSATPGADIRVDYKATLNKNAEIGLSGNPNEVYLEYSNNPNDNDSTGETPIDKVIVFTYELDVNKVDGTDKQPLKDAEFILSNSDETLWAVVDDNGKLTGWTETKADATTLTSDDDGFFKVAGLDEGTYKLHETKAPDGYNKLDNPIEFTITATTTNGQEWTPGKTPAEALTKIEITIGDKTANGNVDNGTVTAQIENNSGAELPETGGIGTKIFYILGALLVIGAGVTMIARRRMGKES